MKPQATIIPLEFAMPFGYRRTFILQAGQFEHRLEFHSWPPRLEMTQRGEAGARWRIVSAWITESICAVRSELGQ